MIKRESLEQLIKQYAVRGKIAQYVWQRDCDCTEWDQMSLIKADVKTIQKEVNSIYEGAEGPVRWEICPPSALKEFRSSHRDRILEAFENGSSYSV